MKVLFYSIKEYESSSLLNENNNRFDVTLETKALSLQTADLAKGFDAVCIFANDDASAAVIESLKKNGVRYIAIRAAGFDNVDIAAANEAEIVVANVPQYSPHAIAEHAILMMLALNRKLILSHEQVCRKDFTVNKLVGFDMYKKKVGIIGTGKIGSIVAKILHGFGCTIMAYDAVEDVHLMNNYDVHYVGLNTLCSFSDIITIHVPLNKETKYLVNEKLIRQMKKGAMLINTARGAIVKTDDVLAALQSGQIGSYAMDVYEREKGIFFYDYSGKNLDDPLLTTLLNMPNVLVTPHQAFATSDALKNIASTTFASVASWSENDLSSTELTYRKVSERLVT